MAVSPEAAKSSIAKCRAVARHFSVCCSPQYAVAVRSQPGQTSRITSCRLSARSPVPVSPAPLSARRAVAAEAVSYAPAGASKSVAEPGYAPELGVASTHAQAGEASVSGSRAREQGSQRELADAPTLWRPRPRPEGATAPVRPPAPAARPAAARGPPPPDGRATA